MNRHMIFWAIAGIAFAASCSIASAYECKTTHGKCAREAGGTCTPVAGGEEWSYSEHSSENIVFDQCLMRAAKATKQNPAPKKTKLAPGR